VTLSTEVGNRPENQAHARVISFDGWVLRRAPRELLRDGRCVRLQDQPLQILEELVTHPNQLLTREYLTARLWPRGVVNFDGSLNTAVRKLRAALRDDADTPRYIETVPRQGYRFIGQLDAERTQVLDRNTPGPAPTVANTVSEPTRIGGRPVAGGRRQMLLWATAVALVVAIASIIVVTRTPSSQQHVAPAEADVSKFRIAVLPFENLSPDPTDAFFTDGLHEEILSTLANRATNLEVISGTTMRQYRATSKAVPAIARELGVTHLLEGSVRRDGHDVRLTLQLINARTDTQLWSHNYDRQLTNAMTLQSQVAAEVASQLAVKLSANSEQLPPAANLEAYDLYLKAKLEAQTFGGRASLERILKVQIWLDEAIALDPSFAAAYLERSRLYLRKFENSYDLSESNLQATRSDLDRVRSLAGDVPLVLAVQSDYAQAVDWDLGQALRLLATPQVLASQDPTVLLARATTLATAHRLDESLALYQQAARLDPRNQGLILSWHAVLWNARRPAEALRVMQVFGDRTLGRVSFVFSFTGWTDQFDERINPVSDSIDPGSQLMARFNRLRFRNRITDSIDLLERSGLQTMRQDSHSPVTIAAIGRKPIAELHGWAELLLGNSDAAAKDGQIVQDFVAHESVSKWNAWFQRFLAAEAELFLGHKTQATTEARRALAMTPRNLDAGMDRYSPATAAMILAWAGAQDDAVALLEGLSNGFPGLGPAEITRDPLYSKPLANNVRYQALQKRLEAEIAVNQKLFNDSPVGDEVKRPLPHL
jgi:TolB-like protein/DNA-binding winged helix-turn-helix (wHTH) protein